MKRMLFILLTITLLLTTGCAVNESSKFSLDSKYYNSTGFVDIDSDSLNELITSKASFILFTYNPYCNFSKPCDEVFLGYSTNYNIAILKIPFEQFKNTKLHDTVKYAPSVIIINKGKIVDYLASDSDEDYDLYQETDKFSEWVNQYINI